MGYLISGLRNPVKETRGHPILEQIYSTIYNKRCINKKNTIENKVSKICKITSMHAFIHASKHTCGCGVHMEVISFIKFTEQKPTYPR